MLELCRLSWANWLGVMSNLRAMVLRVSPSSTVYSTVLGGLCWPPNAAERGEGEWQGKGGEMGRGGRRGREGGKEIGEEMVGEYGG